MAEARESLDAPQVEEDVTNANLHLGSTVTGNDGPLAADADRSGVTSPFDGLRSQGGVPGLIELPGLRADYLVEAGPGSTFVLKHIASGEEVRVAGIESVRFADLQLDSAFLERTNPSGGRDIPATEQAEPSSRTMAGRPLDQAAAQPDDGGPAQAAPPASETPSDGPGTSDDGDGGDLPPQTGKDDEPGDPPGGEIENRAPQGVDSRFVTAEDGSMTFTSAQLLAGASDPRRRCVGDRNGPRRFQRAPDRQR